MEKIKILWVDDEIEILKPHIMFLEQKGYDVDTSNNGDDGLEMIMSRPYDIIFLDENMPGLTGIETLERIKSKYPNLPVVMITKSEEESIMEDAIGSNIADFLIKPVKPNQILLSLKKNLENKKLVSEKTSSGYQQEFRNISMDISNNPDHKGWVEIFQNLTRWELELEKSSDDSMQEVLQFQKNEANQVFSKYYENNYLGWINGRTKDYPVMSPNLFKDKIFPLMDSNESLFVILIDNLRYDQWKAIQPILEEFFRIEKEEIYYSILPSTTQYARNAIFAGLMPLEIERKYPKYWTAEEDEGTKNQFEGELLGEQLKRHGKDVKYGYQKILNLTAGRKLVETMPNLINNKLTVIVYNFVDMLSHARTEMEIIRELADDEKAYRSLMVSWFNNSPLFDILKYLAEKKINVVITTDHGSVRSQDPVKVVGDRNTTTNLRYKSGKSLNYNYKEVFEVKNPHDAFLPRTNVSSTYIFCRKNDFFAYPNNYNYYVNYYRNTFQHGGISLEEILVPVAYLKAK
jgi:DNA-binding response OmpR family regulator